MTENHTHSYIIEGEKILLRPITTEDTELIVKWRNTASVRNNFIYRGAFTADVHTKWMNTKVASGEVVQFIIVDKISGLSIGSVYLRDINHQHESAEYGVFIGEEIARGCGFGTEAAKLLTEYAFNTLNLHRISLRLLGGNTAAQRSYEKAGFVVEGIFKDMVKLDGKYTDIIFMAKIREGDKNA